MAMLDDAKMALRIQCDESAFDNEVNMLIESAISDMLRVGIDPEYLGVIVDEYGHTHYDPPSLVRHAIICYVKSNFGYDNNEAARFDSSYRQIVCDLLNSKENTASHAV